MGRLTQARSGAEARGQTSGIDRNVTPYKHDYTFNAFGNVTSRQTFTWTEADNQTSEWTNGRESTWLYDADGRLKHTEANNYDYNVSGAVVAVALAERRTTYQMTDGDGRTVRRDFYMQHPVNGRNQLEKVEYAIYSSALGQLLTELNADGTKKRTFVYGAGGVVATQNGTATNAAATVFWQHHDPANASHLSTTRSGEAIYANDENGQAELDPLGSNVGAQQPVGTGGRMSQSAGPSGWGSWGDPFGGYSCRVDGFSVPCSYASQVLSSGAGSIGPLDPIAAWQQFRRSDGTTFWRAAFWERMSNGQLGYLSWREQSGNTGTDTDTIRIGELAWHPFQQDMGFNFSSWQQGQSGQTRTDFHYGTRGGTFTSEQKDRLEAAYRRINEKDCLDWINKVLEPFITYWAEGGEKGPIAATSAQNLISKVNIHAYNQNLTREQMNILEEDFNQLKENDKGIVSGFKGYVATDGRYGFNLWLNTGPYGAFNVNRAVLSAVIVHEMLHLFGREDPEVANLNKEIEENCGNRRK